MSATEIHYSGPLLADDGVRAHEIMDRYLDAASRDVAQEGVNRIHVHLGEVLKQNTGHYMSMIHADRQVADMVITDTPVIYGPWLEGEGSRNFPKTRFRGYHTFRRITQGLRSDAGDIADRTLHDGRYLEELNEL